MRELREDEVERFGKIIRKKQQKNRYKRLIEDGEEWVTDKM